MLSLNFFSSKNFFSSIGTKIPELSQQPCSAEPSTSNTPGYRLPALTEILATTISWCWVTIRRQLGLHRRKITMLMVHRAGWICRQPRPHGCLASTASALLPYTNNVQGGMTLPSSELIARISSYQLRIFTSGTPRCW
jgi:hypothetical protein